MKPIARFLARLAAAFVLLCALGYVYSVVSGGSARFSITALLLLGGFLVMAVSVGAPGFFGRRGAGRTRPLSDHPVRPFSWTLIGLCVFVAGIAAAIWLPATHGSPGHGRCVNVTTGDGRHWHLFGHAPELIKGPCRSGRSGQTMVPRRITIL
jgi:hypothetical protein